MQNKKIIWVTGGAGFIGSNLVANLIQEGHEVHIFDDFSSGSYTNLAYFGLVTVNVAPGLKYMSTSGRLYIHKGCVTNEQLFLIPGNCPDEVYHLACPASPIQYSKDPMQTFATCVVGTETLCKVIRSLEVQHQQKIKLVFTSTSEAYGEPAERPQNEKSAGYVNTLGPRSCYDEGKRAAETVLYLHHKRDSLDIRIARLFNTFGPGMQPSDGRVISNFLVALLKNEAITIYGNGEQTRSFCYIDDTIEALKNLMALQTNEIVLLNIGNDVEYTIKEVAHIVQSAYKDWLYKRFDRAVLQPFQIKNADAVIDEPFYRQPDLTKTKKLLGWSPDHSFSKNFSQYIENTCNAIWEILTIKI